MTFVQPNVMISEDDLGLFDLNGKKFVVHTDRGCPKNAVVEIFRDHLRCWACRVPLTQGAANYVESRYQRTASDTFVVR